MAMNAQGQLRRCSSSSVRFTKSTVGLITWRCVPLMVFSGSMCLSFLVSTAYAKASIRGMGAMVWVELEPLMLESVASRRIRFAIAAPVRLWRSFWPKSRTEVVDKSEAHIHATPADFDAAMFLVD